MYVLTLTCMHVKTRNIQKSEEKNYGNVESQISLEGEMKNKKYVVLFACEAFVFVLSFESCCFLPFCDVCVYASPFSLFAH